MSESSVKTHSDGTKLVAEVHGFLAAESELFQLDLSSVEHLHLDLKDTSDISSMGVKSWIQWIQAMPKSCEITLVNCPHAIMNQVAVVTGFVPENIRCESVAMPYYCDTCHKEELVKYEQGKNYLKTGGGAIEIQHPSRSCDREDCKMTPDVLEQKFQEFVSKLKF